MQLLRVVDILVKNNFFDTVEEAAGAIEAHHISVAQQVLGLHIYSNTGSPYGFHVLGGAKIKLGIRKAGTKYYEPHEVAV